MNTYNKYQPSILTFDPWPNVWRIWIDEQGFGDVTIAEKRRLEQQCRSANKSFKAEYIGRNVSSGSRHLNREA